MIFTTGQQIGKYQIITFLGAGHFAETYLVFDRNLMRQTVLKLFFDGNLDALLKEARIQTALSHQYITEVNSADVIINVPVNNSSLDELLDKYPNLANIPSIINAQNTNSDAFVNVLCIDMEFMQGGSLGSKLKQQYISVKDTINYMIKILSALEYIHTTGFIHKDIKPDNILLDISDTPKLADFGLSEHINNATNFGYTTHLPPECYKGFLPNILSDVYACGMTLYRVVNNFRNWNNILITSGIQQKDIEKGSIIDKIKFQPYVPSKLITVIKKATHKDPSKRYQSASEFRDALAKICPKVLWKPISKDKWVCENGKNREEIAIEFLPRKKIYNVCIKRNGKTLNKLTKNFESEQEAYDEMFSYIRESYK